MVIYITVAGTMDQRVYRLDNSLHGVCPSSNGIIQIPVGSILTLEQGCDQTQRFTIVRWAGRIMHIFRVDLETHATPLNVAQ